jgi:hypothetical protein
MKQLMIVFAAAAMLAACGSAAADDREVASLSTTGDATTDTSDTSADSGSEATESTGPVDPSEGPLQFAKCMREHGIDMPDPIVGDNGGVAVQVGGPGQEQSEVPDRETLDAANKECRQFLERAGAGFEPPSAEDQKKMQEQALVFSKCMRDHGIDMPDPQFSTDGGGFNVSIGSEDGPTSDLPPIDFNSDEFQEASEACGQDGGGFVVSAEPVGG